MTTPTGSLSAEPPTLSAPLALLLATACGAIAANLYYGQPLVAPISAELGMTPEAAGLIVTLTQIGYGAGLLLIVPLADRLENRSLILTMIGLAAISLLACAAAPTAGLFLIAAFAIGAGSVAVQILVPYASHMAPPEVRGRVVGNVMSGLLLGIMLARPVSSLVTEFFSWRAVYVLSAGAMALLMLVLAQTLPPRRPEATLSYAALLRSLGRLVVAEPILRRRALYQAAMFGLFSLFWTASPLLLLSPSFGMTQSDVALFALAGAAGAVAAPIAGRLADRNLGRPGTVLAMLIAASALPMTLLAPEGSTAGLVLLTAAAILIDFAAAANLIFGQRALYLLNPALRARLNGVFMATFFTGGAAGSAIGAWAFASGGWPQVVWIGAILPLLALAYFLCAEGRRGPGA